MKLLSVIVVVCLAGVAGSAHAKEPFQVGIQDEYFLLPGDPNGVYPRADQIGASAVKAVVRWDQAMPLAQARAARRPANIAWSFDRLAGIARDARARGYSVQVVLTGPAPRWANTSGGIGVVAPEPRDFAVFAGAATRALRAAGVDRYAIWNEPNYTSSLRPVWLCDGRPSLVERHGGCRMEAARIYRELYRAGYAAIKRNHQSAEVILGELAPTRSADNAIPPLRYLRALLCTDRAGRRIGEVEGAGRCGRSPAATFVSIHPYEFRLPLPSRVPADPDEVTVMVVERLENYLDRVRRSGALRMRQVRVLASEFGYHTSGKRATSAKLRASLLRSGLEHLRRSRYVEQVVQYQIQNPPVGAWFTGLFSVNGTAYDTFTAYRDFARARRGTLRAPQP